MLRRKLLTLVFVASSVGTLWSIAPAIANASSECYWSGEQSAQTPWFSVGGGVKFWMKANWYYGYNCYGQMISERVSMLKTSIDFTNNGNYDPNVPHYIQAVNLYPWDPRDKNTSPQFQDTHWYSCTGGCVLTHTWYPNVTWADSRYAGTNFGFRDAAMNITCGDCSVAGGNLAVIAGFTFARNNYYYGTQYPGGR